GARGGGAGRTRVLPAERRWIWPLVAAVVAAALLAGAGLAALFTSGDGQQGAQQTTSGRTTVANPPPPAPPPPPPPPPPPAAPSGHAQTDQATALLRSGAAAGAAQVARQAVGAPRRSRAVSGA